MTTTPASPASEAPSKRPWRRLHLSTWVVIFLLAGFFVIVEVPGEELDLDESPPSNHRLRETFLHGWPWAYLNRRALYSPTSTEKAPWLIGKAWKLFSQYQSCEFSFPYLALDIVICLTVIFLVAVGFEWRRRLRTRLFQFTLRELLLLILITAGALSWWRIHHNRRILEQDIVNRFQESDGVRWYEEYSGPQILAKLVGRKQLDDFWSFLAIECDVSSVNKHQFEECLACIKYFPNLKAIVISDHGDGIVNDETLVTIAPGKRLMLLDLECVKITDVGMKTISSFRSLQYLNLARTLVTSRGVQCLKTTPVLESLDLSGTKIDDAAAETIADLQNLTDLSVPETNLTDKAVPHLGRLSRLRYLYIYNTKITEKGYQELKSMLPKCEIL